VTRLFSQNWDNNSKKHTRNEQGQQEQNDRTARKSKLSVVARKTAMTFLRSYQHPSKDRDEQVRHVFQQGAGEAHHGYRRIHVGGSASRFLRPI
jgi:hypothetical protein